MDMHAPPGHLDMNLKCLSPLNESHAKMGFQKASMGNTCSKLLKYSGYENIYIYNPFQAKKDDTLNLLFIYLYI